MNVIKKPIKKYKFQVPNLRNSDSVELDGIKEPLFLTSIPDNAETVVLRLRSENHLAVWRVGKSHHY